MAAKLLLKRFGVKDVSWLLDFRFLHSPSDSQMDEGDGHRPRRQDQLRGVQGGSSRRREAEHRGRLRRRRGRYALSQAADKDDSRWLCFGQDEDKDSRNCSWQREAREQCGGCRNSGQDNSQEGVRCGGGYDQPSLLK